MRPRITVAFQYLCFVLWFLLTTDIPPSQCQSQIYMYPYEVPISVNPLFMNPWGTFRPFAIPLGSRFVYIINGYSHPIGSFHESAAQTNVPFYSQLRQVRPLSDFGAAQTSGNEKFHIRPADDESYLEEKGADQTFQCGVSSLIRSVGAEQRPTQHSIRQSRENSGDEKGSVLLTSNEFQGPDLSGTAFEKYKGLHRISSTKITYGILTQNREAPWQVAMFVDGKFHCGASLISDRHVLTACHCVSAYKTRPDLLQLSIGDWDLQTVTDGANVEVKVKKVIPHPNFNYFELQNDIAVLELKQKVDFSDRIRPICLPPADLEVEGSPITVTGWGRNEKNLLQSKLHKLTAIVVKNKLCADRWSTSGAPPSLIGDGIMCMDAQYGDSCKGDSGGPAAKEYPSGSGILVQAGIVSFGSSSCTDAFLPGVYTRVAKYRDWITEQMTN